MDVLLRFSLNNWEGILIALIPALINWGIVLYTLIRFPKNPISSLFACFVSALAIWQTSDALMRMTPSLQTAQLWYGILSLGVFLVSPLGLHFLLFFTGEEKLGSSPIIILMLYGPAILFEQLERSGLSQGSIPQSYQPLWGWVAGGNTLGLMEGLWIAGLATLIILTLALYMVEIWNIPEKRNQTILIVVGLLFPTIQGTITQVIFPDILHIQPIPVSSTVLTIFSLTTIIAITKYGLLRITPAIAAETIINTIEDIILIIGPDGFIHFINQEGEHRLGIKQTQAEEHKFYELLPENSEERRIWEKAVFQQISKEKTIKGMVCYLESFNNQKTPYLISAAPIQTGSAKPAILIVAHDITNRIKMEEQLRLTNQQLEKEKAILTSIGDGVIATDNEGKIIFVNQATQDLLGYTAEESLKKDLKSLVKMTDEKGKILLPENRPISQALENNKKISATAYYQRKDKQLFPISFTVTPIILNGKNFGALEIFRDITKETQIDKAKTEFVSLASHQLRTPPTTIKWYTELLLQEKKEKMSDKQIKYVSVIHKECLRMISLVNSLLNVSRLELGTFAVTPEMTTIKPIMAQIISELEPQTKKKKIKLNQEISKDIPQIKLDKRLFSIILENLLTNAIKYTPDKGNISIHIGANKLQKTITIHVKDNGYGIPQDQQDKIFTKLFRADNAAALDSNGTGLGLYITKQIVDQTGGKIWFTSKENKGTTFSVEFPLKGMEQKEGDKYLD